MADKNYTIVLSETSLDKIISFKNDLLSEKLVAGAYLKKSLDTFSKQGVSLEQMSNEQFIDLLLSTKLPKVFGSSIKCDGTDWTRTELLVLGDVNIAMPVEIYDNGVWVLSDGHFRTHDPPLQGELLFTPGPLLRGKKMKLPPDLEEISTGASIDQNKYNSMIDRRMTPLLYHANDKAKKEKVSALITIPGVGCGVFAGKYKGQMGERLNKALQYIVTNHAIHWTHISCIYYDPFEECKNEQVVVHSVNYRVRPRKYNPDRSQLMDPKQYQEPGDDFSKCKLFKIVAWDHVSFPGNNFFEKNSRRTDDGVSAAATNSMEVITGVKGNYVRGKYLPPRGKTEWKQVVQENQITLRAKGNVNIATKEGSYVDLSEFECREPPRKK
uniref:Macrodomain effector MavL domain-containing protein n=1 Tax=Cacopsylla melanoneura TaxID=428564 RepID=A0A8D8Y8X8_9HEMI